MNKKFLTVAAVLAVFAAFSVSAASKKSAAIGLQGGYAPAGYENGSNVAITFKLASAPCVFAVNGAFSNNYFGVGLTADWWLKNPKLSGMFHYYYGPGLAFGASIIGGDNGGLNYLYAAGRFVAGVNVFVVPSFELYLQAAGQLGVTFGGDGGFYFPYWSVPLNLGFRFWF